MKSVSEVYKGRFFQNRRSLSWRVPYVVDALISTFDLYPGSTVVDMGCGIGDYVLGLKEREIAACGIEGSREANAYFVTDDISNYDLRLPLPFRGVKKLDLAFSLEVAEHIEPEYADVYVQNLCSSSDTILISAASPGQKGHGHYNCQPRGYWIEKFQAFGYENIFRLEVLWRANLSEVGYKKELDSYRKNSMVFKRRLNE